MPIVSLLYDEILLLSDKKVSISRRYLLESIALL